MVRRLSFADADCAAAFADLIASKRDSDADVGEAAGKILAAVKARGDEAVIDFTAQFDQLTLTPATLRVSKEEIAEAVTRVDADTLAALTSAAERIAAYHQKLLPEDLGYTDAAGIQLGARWRPIDAVGIYVPGGRAAYPSSVLMNAIPARIAGVPRIVMVVPTPKGVINPLVLAAADIAGVHEIYRIGGAQAVGALAYGTDTIKPVDKIVGPGNAYVAAAKRQVFGTVGIDMIAGPSEILVVADGANDPAWIAADLLSQAEHDPSSQSILITDDALFADKVAQAVEAHLQVLPRAEIARASWEGFGGIVVVDDLLRDAPSLVDKIAPEHLEIASENPDAIAEKVRHAGAIFLGRHTPEAIGDYLAGPNHVLPTSGSARFSSGLGTMDFLKRTSIVRCTPEGLAAVGPAAVKLAEAEGLGAHGLSVAIRLNIPRG
ncbi:MAG TPA: histidinol dehydrogenase [Alphaproteobacteria bacterium]|nr:histidinol dehydrogenase [Alphaproteobacteria bacterium]